MHSVFFIAIRRLRAPLILLILIFAFATTGLTLIPGIDAAGKPWHMTLFQAFYFVTYTATTIGFGEVPHAFTDTQRLFATLIIYLSVIGWAYLLGSLLGLAQDRGFQQAIITSRFKLAVFRLKEPFYLVCGLGETGMTVVRSLDKLGYRFVALDRDDGRIQELELEEMASDAPALAADARSPEALASAGLLKPECVGVLALANDDHSNLAISIAARLLRANVPVIARVESATVTASMISLGTYQVINPFREFSEHLALAMRAPDSHRLFSWLTGPPGTYLPPRVPAPPGRWIVCGYGRFGAEVVAAIQRGGFEATIVDPTGATAGGMSSVKGEGTDLGVLQDAGAADASGIVAGTDDDTANLAIAIAARSINPGIFVILRQNLQSNEMLFRAFAADMTMVSSQIIANECLAVLRTPLLSEFLRLIKTKDDVWAYKLVERLQALTGDETPRFWSISISPGEAPGLVDVMGRFAAPVRVGDLARSVTFRSDRMPCIPLLLARDGALTELPADDVVLRLGDRILFAGREPADEHQRLIMRNANVAGYTIFGSDELGSWVWRKLKGLRRGRRAAALTSPRP